MELCGCPQYGAGAGIVTEARALKENNWKVKDLVEDGDERGTQKGIRAEGQPGRS